MGHIYIFLFFQVVQEHKLGEVENETISSSEYTYITYIRNISTKKY